MLRASATIRAGMCAQTHLHACVHVLTLQQIQHNLGVRAQGMGGLGLMWMYKVWAYRTWGAWGLVPRFRFQGWTLSWLHVSTAIQFSMRCYMNHRVSVRCSTLGLLRSTSCAAVTRLALHCLQLHSFMQRMRDIAAAEG